MPDGFLWTLIVDMVSASLHESLRLNKWRNCWLFLEESNGLNVVSVAWLLVQFLLNQWNERFRVRSDLVLGSEHLVVELIEVNELL